MSKVVKFGGSSLASAEQFSKTRSPRVVKPAGRAIALRLVQVENA